MFLGKLENLRRRRSGATTTVTDAVAGEKEEKGIRLLGQQRLADLTGSRAYERFTGSQILKVCQWCDMIQRSEYEKEDEEKEEEDGL